jgi:hypothetical protein
VIKLNTGEKKNMLKNIDVIKQRYTGEHFAPLQIFMDNINLLTAAAGLDEPKIVAPLDEAGANRLLEALKVRKSEDKDFDNCVDESKEILYTFQVENRIFELGFGKDYETESVIEAIYGDK